ncbi:hypothetical protein [Streptomyces canus]|uniref:hypothetical protein n=1 Tax=Streptomyces canus TaxID=58343 RepID=UPI000381C3CB|nr:hypothetical protein [Streptomyces canus]
MTSNATIDYDVQNKVVGFVSKLVGRRVEADEALISSGLLESLAAVQLIHFVENELGVAVEDGEIDLANFDSAQAITALVRSKASSQ